MKQLGFHVTLALRALQSNRLRFALTVSIIALGLWALIGILTCIEVLKLSVNSNFSRLGANTFQITNEVIKRNRRGREPQQNKIIKYEDARQFKEQYSFPATIGLSMRGSSTAEVRWGAEKTNPNITTMGVDENYLSITNTELDAGRNFTPSELQSGATICIIGNGIAKKLFKNKPQQAIDKVISIGEMKYRIIGVSGSKGGSMLLNADNLILLPLQNARAVYGSKKSIVLSIQLANVLQKPFAADEAEGLLRRIRKIPIGDAADFTIIQNDGLTANLLEVINYIGMAALVIGIITLVGSIIGLMNIMLVSVSERTREIGINKALGAPSASIKSQFLTESILISITGGAIGILLGILTGNLLGLLFDTGFVIPWMWISIGVALCATVGVVSGIFPALKASKLDPIVALRYE
ncbi:MAG: FtsX-like permease family protein [Bacteroidia bacterium]|nr:MAG: FtsX-like permease family protein [Bacteroidia bacterium]